MNHALKGALLSGLVYPGLGQAVLKHPRRAVVLMLVFTTVFVATVVKMFQQATAILDKALLDTGFLDMDTISEAAARASHPADDRTIHLLFGLLIACWALGVVDAALLGRRKDRAEQTTSPR